MTEKDKKLANASPVERPRLHYDPSASSMEGIESHVQPENPYTNKAYYEMAEQLSHLGLNPEQSAKVISHVALTVGLRGAATVGGPDQAAWIDNGEALDHAREWVLSVAAAAQQHLAEHSDALTSPTSDLQKNIYLPRNRYRPPTG